MSNAYVYLCIDTGFLNLLMGRINCFIHNDWLKHCNQLQANIWVFHHVQNVSGKSVCKIKRTRLFRSFEWKISGNTGMAEKLVLFFRSEFSKQKFRLFTTYKKFPENTVRKLVEHDFSVRFSRISKPSLRQVSSFRSRFSVNGTDLCKWYTRFGDAEIYPVLNFAYHLPIP